MNLLAQLQFAHSVQAPAAKRDNTALHAARRRNTLAKYTQAFDGQQRTTPEIAARLGISPCSAFIQLARFEQRGLTERVGTRPTGGKATIIWTWKGQQ